MAETTKIQWTHHTFNPWIGCTKVAPGCANCYAEADMDKRRGRVAWGPKGTRSRTTDAYWREPLKWNKSAAAAGERHRVFCASLADVFEDWQGPILNSHGKPLRVFSNCTGSEWYDTQEPPNHDFATFALRMDWMRRDLFALIDATPNLDWLLLTKRPENIAKMWAPLAAKRAIFPGCPGPLGEPIDCILTGAYRENVWLGTSISDQTTANKAIPQLIQCRYLAPVLFLSAEPLLDKIDLVSAMPSEDRVAIGRGHPAEIDWVIIGGESGPHARPCWTDWIRDMVTQAKDAEMSVFVKQLGSHIVENANPPEASRTLPAYHTEAEKMQFVHELGEYMENIRNLKTIDPKGGDMHEWPENLRVREFPVVE